MHTLSEPLLINIFESQERDIVWNDSILPFCLLSCGRFWNCIILSALFIRDMFLFYILAVMGLSCRTWGFQLWNARSLVATCKDLVPWPGIVSRPPALGAWAVPTAWLRKSQGVLCGNPEFWLGELLLCWWPVLCPRRTCGQFKPGIVFTGFDISLFYFACRFGNALPPHTLFFTAS